MKACRSLLYVPGNRIELLRKILRFEADAFILDLEDGIPPQHKEEARETIASIAKELVAAGKTLHARVNAVHTPWHRDDVERMLDLGITRLHVPKVSTAEDVRVVDHQVYELATRWRLPLESIELYPTLETSRGMLAAADICGASARVAGVLLGADDFTAEVGATRTAAGREIDYVRQHIVVAANAHGVMPIDATFPFHRDLAGCEADARHARAIGFRGKQAIHPAQCAILNTAFTPSEQELERARAIVAAAEEARGRGHGTAAAHGTQIDAAVESSARRLLEWSADAEPDEPDEG